MRHRLCLLLGLLLPLVGPQANAQVGETVQNNLSGNWIPIIDVDYITRGAGPSYGAYEGIPLNAAARTSALTMTETTLAQLDRQCEPWSAHYIVLGPFGLQIWPTIDARSGHTIAWNISGTIDRLPMTVWMDGRNRPSQLTHHTYAGSSTGRWEGDTLVVTTTNLKDGFLTRNGVPASDKESITMFLTPHDGLLTLTESIHDPVYLTAPYMLAGMFRSSPVTPQNVAFPQSQIVRPMTCTPEEEIPTLSDGYHFSRYLPGQNQTGRDETKIYGIPAVAVVGGAQTMYPEFQKQMQGQFRQPAGYCTSQCCGTNTTAAFDAKVLHCSVNPP
jgi:hypothetical protein